MDLADDRRALMTMPAEKGEDLVRCFRRAGDKKPAARLRVAENVALGFR